MKLLRKNLTKDGGGSVKLVPDDAEDLWHAYNLVAEGDMVSATTVRKVQKETSSGGSESERVRLNLCVEVEAIEFDSTASILRLRGKNVTENEHVRLGAYHTLELEQQRPFTLRKGQWDSLALDRLKQCTDPCASADVAAVLMQEGLANVCLFGGSMTVVRARIESAIPRKRGAAIAGYDKALNRFFENILQSILRHVDFSIVKCLILASPGFTKDQFHSYMLLEASRRDLRQIIDNKSKIILTHASSGYKHALKEVLASPSVQGQIKDTKAAKEVMALEEFFSMLSSDSARAFYGLKHVEAAQERLAVDVLLVTDSLFRNANVATRKRYVALVESVKESGGQVHIFSSMHVSGEQLAQMTGVAAILRFPLPDIEDMEL
ncbi:hypothetical protein CBR_g24366 [Chara braunii]|uniref:Protein pelota homolog n=1 Tax=Chara braunii TaxID=69332 RepID=A0A388JMJ4_CHABU|nr:hypothetical protein CBR_g24366 [Chara braunii]|eukprot:GBG59018.1 hypothetical protein CBR_g24366 [Chara braunii]